jgi:cell division septation protein DedD
VEIKTKQRMIGILIILIILLILIPLLFSNSKQPSSNESITEQVLAGAAQPEAANPEQQPAIPAEQLQDGENQLLPTTEQSPAAVEPPQVGLESPSAVPEQSATVEPPLQLANVVAPNEHKVVEPPATSSDKASSKITAPIKADNETSTKVHSVKVNKTTTQVKKWTVQLATFSKKSNATQLLSKLKSAGFEPRLKEQIISGSKNYRVFVGHYDHNKAKKVAYKLEKKYHLKGFVVRS